MQDKVILGKAYKLKIHVSLMFGTFLSCHILIFYATMMYFFTFYFLLMISSKNAYLGKKVTVHFSFDTLFDVVVSLSSYT